MQLVWVMIAMPAQAASFDCAKASTSQEKLICFDYRLSDLDSQLAWIYSKTLKQAKDPLVLKQSQKDWLATREKCADVNCILYAYVRRIEALSPESKLEEVYFPKSDIPWDFFPQPGDEISSSAHIKDNKLTCVTYLKGTMTHGKESIIPKDKSLIESSEHEADNKLQELSLVNSKFEIVKILPDNAFVELGDLRLAFMSSSYSECEGGLGSSGIYVGRNLAWTKNNVLVELRPHDWAVWKNPGDDPGCQEADLKIDPTMMEIIAYNQSLYLNELHGASNYVLRLDRNLQTASPLLGKKIFLGWGKDLEALTGNACDKFINSSLPGFKTYSTKHRICIDQQLQKLIGEVGRFYP